MIRWLFSPTKLPKSPSWTMVFMFGAAWNALVEQCWWAVLFCLVVLISLPALGRADRQLFDGQP